MRQWWKRLRLTVRRSRGYDRAGGGAEVRESLAVLNCTWDKLGRDWAVVVPL